MIEAAHCCYRLLDNQIHNFVFEKPTRVAVDEHVAKLDELYRTVSPDGVLRILIDLRISGLPPMSYTASSLRKLNAKYPNLPSTRYAFLFSSGIMISLASAFFNLLNPSKGTARFFQGDKEQEAIAWLLNA